MCNFHNTPAAPGPSLAELINEASPEELDTAIAIFGFDALVDALVAELFDAI